MKISIVTTLYHTEKHVKELYARLKKAVNTITDSYEIIFVNDASPDHSLDTVLQLQQQDKNIVLIDLSRNYGQHKAIMTGLSYASGDLVYLLDSDLEEEPEWLNLFYQKLTESKGDVVYGKQKARKGGWFERISGNVFYKLFNWITGVKLNTNITTARLMTKRYVKNLVRFKERELFLAGLWHITGFVQTPLYVEKHNASKTTYTFRKKLNILINALTSFTNKPLILIFYTGLLISFVSTVYIIYLLASKLFFAHTIPGWHSLIVSVWFLGGLMILFLGVIGIYLSKIFVETKNRPYTIIKQVYRHE